MPQPFTYEREEVQTSGIVRPASGISVEEEEQGEKLLYRFQPGQPIPRDRVEDTQAEVVVRLWLPTLSVLG